MLSNDDIEVFRDHYLDEEHDRTDFRLSPILAPDLTGLPPAVVVVAGLDPLHDSGVRYAQALADAGNEVMVEDFHQMPHGFLSFPVLLARRPAGDGRDRRVPAGRPLLSPARRSHVRRDDRERQYGEQRSRLRTRRSPTGRRYRP